MLKKIFCTILLLMNLGLGFLTVSGNKILDDQGLQVLLQGFALDNGIFSQWNDILKQIELPQDGLNLEWSLTEKDVRDLKDKGVTAARYCLNIEQFEKNNPLKEQNYKIFEKRLSWFKQNKIYVVINLHIPPGFAGQIRPKEKSIFEDENHWQIFEDFWKEFLTRYKQEVIIAGWEFFNEPYLPEDKVMSEEQWYQKIESFIQKMREIDNQHIFFICNPLAKTNFFNPDGTRNVQWNIPFRHKYNDKNIVYVFHFYEPIGFTHQNTNEFLVGGIKYPLEAYEYKKYLSSVGGGAEAVNEEKAGWKKIVVKDITAPAEADYGTPVLSVTKGLGIVYFKDIEIYEITKAGQRNKLALPNPGFVPAIPEELKGKYYDAEKYLFWTTYYSEKYELGRIEAKVPLFKLEEVAGYCLSLENRYQEIANWNTDPKQFCLKPKPRNKYELSGWIKAENPGAFWLGISWYQGNKIIYNQKNLEKFIITNYLKFGQDNDLPVMVTEFGSVGFADKVSRQKWTSDILAIFRKYNLHYTYWCYNGKYGWGYDFGLILKDPFDFSKEYLRYNNILKEI